MPSCGDLDPPVGVADLGRRRLDLGRAVEHRSPVAQRHQPWIVALRQAPVGLGGEHDPPRQLGLGDRPAAMRADLDHQDIADRQLRDHAHERHGDAGGVGVGELGEVAHPHQHLDLGQAAAQLVIAHDRGREAEMDRVEDRVGEERPARPQQPFAGLAQAVQLAVAGRDQHRHGIGLEGEVERVLVQAEQEVGPGPRTPPQLRLIAGIDADQPALRLERLHGLFQMRKRRIGQAAQVDHVRTLGAQCRGAGHDLLDPERRRLDDLGEDAAVVAGEVAPAGLAAEELGQVLELLRAQPHRHAQLRPERVEVALAAARQRRSPWPRQEHRSGGG